MNKQTKDAPDFDTWLADVKTSAGEDFALFNEHYSFLAAFNRGMPANEAVKDCRDWLEA